MTEAGGRSLSRGWKGEQELAWAGCAEGEWWSRGLAFQWEGTVLCGQEERVIRKENSQLTLLTIAPPYVCGPFLSTALSCFDVRPLCWRMTRRKPSLQRLCRKNWTTCWNLILILLKRWVFSRICCWVEKEMTRLLLCWVATQMKIHPLAQVLGEKSCCWQVNNPAWVAKLSTLHPWASKDFFSHNLSDGVNYGQMIESVFILFIYILIY